MNNTMFIVTVVSLEPGDNIKTLTAQRTKAFKTKDEARAYKDELEKGYINAYLRDAEEDELEEFTNHSTTYDGIETFTIFDDEGELDVDVTLQEIPLS